MSRAVCDVSPDLWLTGSPRLSNQLFSLYCHTHRIFVLAKARMLFRVAEFSFITIFRLLHRVTAVNLLLRLGGGLAQVSGLAARCCPPHRNGCHSLLMRDVGLRDHMRLCSKQPFLLRHQSRGCGQTVHSLARLSCRLHIWKSRSDELSINRTAAAFSVVLQAIKMKLSLVHKNGLEVRE